MLLQELMDKKLIKLQDHIYSGCQMLTIVGSIAYGTSSDSSDMDIYGFCIPRLEVIFPHTVGIVAGFGYQGEKFEQWQQHRVFDKDALGGKGRDYDFAVFNIVRYFELLIQNNPNILDSICTAQDCVLHCTQVGSMVRENRKLFFHKGCFKKLKSYAFSQLHKMNNKSENKILQKILEFEEENNIPHTMSFCKLQKEYNVRDKLGHLSANVMEKYLDMFKALLGEGLRYEKVKIDGSDRKFMYHLVRLLDECEQLLMYGDLDLRRNREQLKAIRRGEISEEEIRKWVSDKERQLENLYTESKVLPEKPDEDKVKELLLRCLESHYGNIDKCISVPDRYHKAILQIKDILDKACI